MEREVFLDGANIFGASRTVEEIKMGIRISALPGVFLTMKLMEDKHPVTLVLKDEFRVPNYKHCELVQMLDNLGLVVWVHCPRTSKRTQQLDDEKALDLAAAAGGAVISSDKFRGHGSGSNQHRLPVIQDRHASIHIPNHPPNGPYDVRLLNPRALVCCEGDVGYSRISAQFWERNYDLHNQKMDVIRASLAPFMGQVFWNGEPELTHQQIAALFAESDEEE